VKITIEREPGQITVFNEVSDVYVVVRQVKVLTDLAGENPTRNIDTTSFSWGSNVRELVKEITQSLTELQDYLKESRHGGSS
jgi:hypothetical protein